MSAHVLIGTQRVPRARSDYWGACSEGAVNLAISFVGCLLLLAIFIATTPAEVHWFIIPVLACGVVIGCDAVRWARGQCDLFDPAGVVGVIGLHFFFLAPLLHVFWNYWIDAQRPAVEPPNEWRDWLGWMAILNFVGLLAYRAVRSWSGANSARPSRSVWRFEGRNLLIAALCALPISVGAQAWLYASQGGISGFIETFTEHAGESDMANGAFAGMGWLFMVAECFPILALICFAAWLGRKRITTSWPAVLTLLAAFFAVRMLFGGLHGSRSNTIWALFWAAGIVHLWIRPLSRKFVFVGVCFLIAFMYLYGFYKSMGANAVAALADDATTSELGESTGRTFRGLVLGDLGRSDVQAFLLYRIVRPNHDYHIALGRTYLATALMFIPKAVWPDRPPGKLKEGTEAQYGVGSFDPEGWASAREYGIAGEGMLNFGPLAVPFAYAFFGFIVGQVQRFIASRDRNDARLLICPFLVVLCFWMLVADSSTMMFVIIKDGLPPALVLWFASRRVRKADAPLSAPVPALA